MSSETKGREYNKVLLHFKEIIESYQESNGGIVTPALTELRLFLDKIQAMANNKIIEKEKLRDNTKGGWHISNLVNFGSASI